MRICMNWRSINFDWNRARAFLVTAEEGSLSAAAKALGLTQPTLSRQVAALEEELGVALFERVGRGFELTPSGTELVELARQMGEAARQLSLTATGKSVSLEGTVCISAMEATAQFQLPAIIQRLRKAEPGIVVEIQASNKISDLKRREADIAIRAVRPTELDLIAKKIRSETYCLFASKEYLASIGNPKKHEVLLKADYIGFDSENSFKKMLSEYGLEVNERNFCVLTQSHSAHWALVKQGLGIGAMLREVGELDPLIERVFPDISFPANDMWLVVHRELKTNKRVKRVFDFLAAELS